MASYVSRELIPCAFVWLDPGITPCCKTRPRVVDQAKSGKNRIRTSGFLNQYSAPVRDLEKNFFARELKIVLQHNRTNSRHWIAAVMSIRSQASAALSHPFL